MRCLVIIIVSILLFLGCVNENNTNSSLKNQKEQDVIVDQEEIDSTHFIFEDENLDLFSQYIRVNEDFINVTKSEYHTLENQLNVTSISVIEYNINDIVEYYYEKMCPSKNLKGVKLEEYSNANAFIEKLRIAKSVLGMEFKSIDVGSNLMIERWEMNDSISAVEAFAYYKKSGDMCFFRTLSFGYMENNYIYIFHSNTTVGSWEIKKFFDWFTEQKSHAIEMQFAFPMKKYI